MDHRRLAALVHRPPPSTNRRQILGHLLGCLLAVGLPPRPLETAARKRRKKRRKKRRRNRPQLSDCARACGVHCNYCVTTVDSTVICVDGTSVACNRPCNSGVDCLGTGFAWCLATQEEVETGLVFSPLRHPWRALRERLSLHRLTACRDSP